MATLPTFQDLGQRPIPQPSTAVASYDPTGIARGLQEAGANLKQTANDFAQLRQSEIETDVNNQYVNSYIPAATKLSQDFYSKQGKDAVDAMPSFIQGLNQQRNDIRDNLQGTYAKQMFDQKAGRHLEMEMESAARYTDQQQKQYDFQTHQAVLKSYADQAQDKAGDPNAFQFALGSAQQEIEDFNSKHGVSADVTKQQISDFRSESTAGMLQSLSINNPQMALAMFEGNKDAPGLSNVIDAKIRPTLQAHLTERANNDEQSKLAQTLLNGGSFTAKDGTNFDIDGTAGTIQSREKDAIAVAQDFAARVHPNDARYADTLISRIKSDASALMWKKNLSDNDALNQVVSGMTDPDTGQRRSFSEAMADPDWQAQYHSLPLAQQGHVRQAFLQEENMLTPDSARMVDGIKGLSVTDPEAFMKYDVGSLVGKIPQAQIEQIINMKASIDRNAIKNNVTASQVTQVTPVLVAAGILGPVGQKTAQYEPFVGRFQDAVSQWQMTNKRVPNTHELKQIASQEVASIPVAGRLWGTNNKPAWKIENTDEVVIPKDDSQKLSQAFQNKFGRAPSSQDLRGMYINLVKARSAQ